MWGSVIFIYFLSKFFVFILGILILLGYPNIFKAHILFMVISETLKKKAGDLANKVAAKVEATKVKKQLSADEQIEELKKRIVILKEVKFENSVKRIEAQIMQIRNKMRNHKK